MRLVKMEPLSSSVLPIWPLIGWMCEDSAPPPSSPSPSFSSSSSPKNFTTTTIIPPRFPQIPTFFCSFLPIREIKANSAQCDVTSSFFTSGHFQDNSSVFLCSLSVSFRGALCRLSVSPFVVVWLASAASFSILFFSTSAG